MNIRSLRWHGAIALLSFAATFSSSSIYAQAFAPPTDGWAYTFDGAAADASDEPFLSLDGTWDHDNGSDAWDGSVIGEGSPGGVITLTEGDTTFIRMQDTGDPRDYDMPDPSNRKVYLTHLLSGDFAEGPDNLDTIVDDGVTLYFRTRVATAENGPLDDSHPSGGGGVEAWPAEGIGYSQHNSGKSMFAIKQSTGATVAFGLDYAGNVNADIFDENGLYLPHRLLGTDPPGQGLSSNDQDADPATLSEDVWSQTGGQVVPVEDLTAWQDFWVTIETGSIEIDGFDDGTHSVNVYHGGSEAPTDAMNFIITAAVGSDFGGGQGEQSYIAIGAGATGRQGAFDVDFFSWAPGIHVPELAEIGGGGCMPINSLAGDLDGSGDVAFADFLILSSNFGTTTTMYEDGDIDCSGDVAFADFLALSQNFGVTLGAEAQSVPEPSGLAIVLPTILLLVWRNRR